MKTSRKFKVKSFKDLLKTFACYAVLILFELNGV